MLTCSHNSALLPGCLKMSLADVMVTPVARSMSGAVETREEEEARRQGHQTNSYEQM